MASAQVRPQAEGEQARLLFEEGNRHLSRGMRARGATKTRALEQALSAYTRCLLIVRSRNLLFNTGLALEGLQEHDRAYNIFIEYMAVEGLSPEEERAGNAHIEALRPQVAVVFVTSVPEGASVRADRRDLPPLGQTPLEVAIAAGSHRLLLDAPAYQGAEAMVTAQVGERAQVGLTLTPSPVQLQVLGSETAEMRLDGERIEPGRSLDILPGAHLLTLLVGGVPVVERRFEANVGADPMVIELRAPAGPQQGTLRLAVNADANVRVDGAAAGSGRALSLQLTTGRHVLSLSAPGYADLEEEISIETSRPLDLNARLGELANNSALHWSRGTTLLGAALGLTLSASFGIAAGILDGKYQQALDQYGRAMTGANHQAAVDMADRLDAALLATDIAGALTLALGASALVSWLVSAPEDETSELQIAISPTRGTGALVMAHMSWDQGPALAVESQ